MPGAIITVLSWLLIISACCFIIVGGIGLLRLPDLYTRLHAASVTDTGGTILLALALFLQALFVFGEPMTAIKVVLILFFTLITSPTASHVLAKTALLSGHKPLDAAGEPLVESSDQASQLARSREARR